MFIIKDDYDSDEDDNFDDNRSMIVDETNLNYYDSDNYTTITEDLYNNSDSDLSVDNDTHSTTSEPFLSSHHRKLTYSQSVGGITNNNDPLLSDQLGFGKKSISNGNLPMNSIPEHKSMIDTNSNSNSISMPRRREQKDGNESDGTG